MALRVLLADESSTIKKVVQLTLQDFDVEVRSVSVGLDVLSVAKTFYPDIIMADVLLAKRSGYEVCHDIKNDPETASIPVVLMWSGFMEIDEQKARLSGADRRIEKPFDPSALRNIVKELVNRTLTNPVSNYVQFPPLPEFQESAKPAAPQQPVEQPAQPKVPPPQHAPQSQMAAPAPQVSAPQAPPTRPAMNIPTQPAPQVPETTGFNFQSLEPTHADIQIPKDNDGALIIDDGSDSNDEWVQKPPPGPRGASPVQPKAPSPRMQQTSEEFSEFPLMPEPNQMADAITAQVAPQMGGHASEAVLREEIQKWLATNMAPIAERIIRDEINRLLQDSDQTIESP